MQRWTAAEQRAVGLMKVGELGDMRLNARGPTRHGDSGWSCATDEEPGLVRILDREEKAIMDVMLHHDASL